MTRQQKGLSYPKTLPGQPDLFGDSLGEPESGIVDSLKFIEYIEETFELSAQAHHVITSAQMNEALAKTDLEHYVQKILNAGREAEVRSKSSTQGMSGADTQLAVRSAAEKAAFDRGDPTVRIVLDAAYKVDREIHRLMGLLRFNPRSDNIWLARCAPDNFILPVYAEHFTAR